MMEIVQFICEIGNISSKMEIYLRKLLIYLRIIRFIDFSTKTTKIKQKKALLHRNCSKALTI